MRTLLIDNYDSFTYNLFHYLAEVNGREPEVVVNDDPRWRPRHLSAFDSVVLSPGPGHPGRDADFGICRQILQRAEVPTLGICLGHQGLAHVHGGTVIRAPEPHHGRVSPIGHTGTGLFADIPSPLEVVRYHSLAVAELPPVLEAIAWTYDGVLMGLRHRQLPLWGLQFHPESIGTSYGRQLLRNFRRLCERHGTRTRRAARPTPAARSTSDLRHRDRRKVRRLRVLTRELCARWDGEAAFGQLFGHGGYAYWLDSSRPDGAAGRFSIMGDAGGPLGRIAEADVFAGKVTVRSARSTDIVGGDFLAWLAHDLRTVRTEVPDLPFDFALGWVGYLGYELKGECGGDRVHRSDQPDAVMVFSDRAVVHDHHTGTTYLLALAEDGDEDAARAWLAGAAKRLSQPGERPPEPRESPGSFGELRLRHDRDAYLRLIEACQEQIAAGESYEICLTNMVESTCDLDPWQGYRFLRRVSPTPFGALLLFGEVSVLSTSPERFLRVDRDRIAETRPIKGTRPRGGTAEDDRLLKAELAASEKDRAENLMIVDLVRNDLGRCAEIGSVRVTGLFEVETYATVHQLVSTVRATLRADRDAVDCVRAAFPPGSMTGAPKRRTMRILDRLEGGARGVYSGAIGYFSLNGTADLSVVIRTVVLTPGRVRYGVGGAIIALSDPGAELTETMVKAAPMISLAGARFPESAHGVRPGGADRVRQGVSVSG
jgi:para-aminobenzoate synthetase